MSNNKAARKSYARIPDILDLPKLIEVQLESFEVFKDEGLRELFAEISPIVSFNKNLELYFLDYRFDESKYSEKELTCKTFSSRYSLNPSSVRFFFT